MIFRKIDTYIKNFYATSNKALLITGARQIGKTFSIRQFGKSFPNFFEINFVDSPEMIKIFKDAKNASDILLRLSAISPVPLKKGETLIFFDEVQLCPEIVTAIKFLIEDGSYRYILSGSLLGVTLKDLRSEPVGFLAIKDMYPIDFEEFIRYLGVGDNVIEHICNAWTQKTAVDSFIHDKLMELFRLYLIVGGMPDAVEKYKDSNNLQEVMDIQRNIINLYKRDIAQYDPTNKLQIENIYNLIPSELNAKNKRFILKTLNNFAKYERYENSFLWLSNAGVAIPVYNVEEPKTPLLLARSRNLFKLFLSDVGLLAAQYADGIQIRIITNDKNINFGSIYENVVAQEFIAHGIHPYYYNNKKNGEIDFIIEDNGIVIPIEIKSGKDYESHRALSNILNNSEYNITKAYVFNNNNLKIVGNIVYAPIYMTMFINKNNTAPIYKVDLSMIN